ncbi:TPA: NAD(P)-dependent oxidoreductase [Photobacterium damselae]
MDFFPVFLRLDDRQVLVVGGGEVACRKVDLLLKAQANITLVSPQLHPYLQQLVANGRLTYRQRCYQTEDLIGFDQVWATTNQQALNQQIHSDATQRSLWVNVVDNPPLCHFITPSMVDRSPIQIAISSGGASPVLVRYLREKIETVLPQNLSLIANYAGMQRTRIKQHFATVDERRKFWEKFFNLTAVDIATTKEELESAFVNLLQNNTQQEQHITVVHVGQDPELLTLKALRLMQQAELVLFATTTPDIFIDLCRRDADRQSFIDGHDLVKLLDNREKSQRICLLTPDKTVIEQLQHNPTYSTRLLLVSAIDNQ